MRDILLKHGNNNIFRNITTLEQTVFRQSEAGLFFQLFLIARTIWLGAPIINMAIMRDISLKHGNHNIFRNFTTLDFRQTVFRQSEAGVHRQSEVGCSEDKAKRGFYKCVTRDEVKGKSRILSISHIYINRVSCVAL